MAASRLNDPEPPDGVRELGNLTLDPALLRATVQGEFVDLTRHELDLLCVLSDQPDHIVPYRTLVQRLWGDASPASVRHLNVVVHRLRAKLGRSFPYTIETVRGRGYGLLKTHESDQSAAS